MLVGGNISRIAGEGKFQDQGITLNHYGSSLGDHLHKYIKLSNLLKTTFLNIDHTCGSAWKDLSRLSGKGKVPTKSVVTLLEGYYLEVY